jgi:endonuclease G
MNYSSVIFLFLLLGFQTESDLVTIKHTNYTTTFSKSKNYPVKVEWWITKSKITCKEPLKRENNFRPDPKFDFDTKFNDDYLNSGYDRGHMCPSADNICISKSVLDESFYFTNISPQQHSLNAGDWLFLEDYSRQLGEKYDSIHIWSGNVGEIKKIKTVSVPKICWKVIYIKKTDTWEAYIFENNKSKANGISDNKVIVKDVESLTGFKFSK